MKFKTVAILTLSSLVYAGAACADPTETATPTTTTLTNAVVSPTPAEGYHGVGWGTSLDDFKNTQKSTTNNSIKRTEKIATLYVLMNFQEPQEKDNYHPTRLSIQKIDGDKTDYVFYKEHYSLAIAPIELSNLDAVRKELASKYAASKELITLNAHWTNSDITGWSDMAFDYQPYVKTAGTGVYLVTVSSFNEDQGLVDQLHYGDVVQHIAGPKTRVAAYLIYVSEDYLRGKENAWADYQAAKTAAAEPTPVIIASPTPSKANLQEKSKQQDLKSVE
jgi:hypothetical protein